MADPIESSAETGSSYGSNSLSSMSDPSAELASIAYMLEDLTNRIGSLADGLSQRGQDALAAELFEVERSLTSGSRRLTRIVNR